MSSGVSSPLGGSRIPPPVPPVGDVGAASNFTNSEAQNSTLPPPPPPSPPPRHSKTGSSSPSSSSSSSSSRSSSTSNAVPNITQQPVSQTLSTYAVTMVTCGVSPPDAQVRWLYNGQPLDHRRHPGLEMLDNGLRFLPLLPGLDTQGEDLWEKELDDRAAAAARGVASSRTGRQAPGTSGDSPGTRSSSSGGMLNRRGNEGEYRCTATTAAGSVVSQPAILSLPGKSYDAKTALCRRPLNLPTLIVT
ncbi:hypothetical protein ElyMa_003177900 [Elysia marginata]|uniref:Ig-like domain-containing protein n=1 Tax=Elysia marginata TaxID=1093978 RepID=A0AAV4IY23_9GAST|nr:hypothetical protein ElyMa_003177900 [Elysia marginata]